MEHDMMQCGVCFTNYNTSTKRPFDLGCGHSFCEQCIQTSPRSFRYCPECRARASNPHANIALLRVLEHNAGGTGAAGSTNPAGSHQQQQQRHRPARPPSPLADILNSGPGQQPKGRLASWLDMMPGNIPVGPPAGAATSAAAGPPAAAAAGAGPANVAGHQAKIAQWRTSMWVYLAPLLGFLYLVSPLDIIPDFLPVIGWLDDLLVVWYVLCSVYNAMQARAGAGAGSGHGQQNQQQRRL